MRRLVVRSILAAAFALAVPASGVAAAAPADTGLARTVSDARTSDALSNALRYADSVAAADSVRLIAELLEANGAPAQRARPAAAAILKHARRNALDPLLVVGVIGVENAALVPRARSRAGARGVMQVMPHWKKDIRDCGTDLTNIDVNVCFGTRILRIALDQSTSVRAALLRYNGCVRSTACRGYPAAVFSRTGQAMLLRRAAEEPAVTRIASAGTAAAGAGSAGVAR